MTDVWQYDKVPSNNQFRWPENTMEGNQINDAGRADEAAIARWYADDNGTLTTAGSATAYTVTNNSNRAAYTDDLIITVRFHVDCGDNPTLNMSGFGAQPILKNGGQQLVSGDVKENQISRLSYRSGNWYLQASLFQGTAGAKDVGTTIGDVVEVVDVQAGTAGLATLDGRNLTGTIRQQPVENTIDPAVDDIAFYDSSAGANRKTIIQTIIDATLAQVTVPPSVWVRFNGSGTILGQAGVSSVTKNGTGEFTVNFSTAWSSATSYAVGSTARRPAGAPNNVIIVSIERSTAPTASSIRLVTSAFDGTTIDPEDVFLTFQGTQ